MRQAGGGDDRVGEPSDQGDRRVGLARRARRRLDQGLVAGEGRRGDRADSRRRGDRAGKARNLRPLGSRRLTASEGGDDLHRVGAAAQLPARQFVADPHVAALRELAERLGSGLDREQGDRQSEQHRRDADDRTPRVGHDPRRPADPERLAVRALAAALEEAQHPRDYPARQHAVAEHRDQRREQGRRGQDRDADHDHRPQRHRAQRLVVDHPQAGERDDHRQPREGDGEARGGECLRPRRVPVASRGALLAVAGEDEERVVDRHADADHRGHVGDEDRGLHLQRDEVDQRPGDDHADEAERQRQGGGGERAEDDEQDDRDDREAAGLRLGQVFLGEFLHPRPDRRLAGEVGGDASSGGARVEVFAQRRRRVDLAVGGDLTGERQQRRAGAAQGDRGASRRARRNAHFVDAGNRAARARNRGGLRFRGGPRLGLQQHRDIAGAVAEVALQCVADRLRLAAGNVEAAAGQVFGLARGERQSEDNDDDPARENPAATTPQNTGKLDHELPHWLDGQPFGPPSARL